jgi:hypothetical protein
MQPECAPDRLQFEVVEQHEVVASFSDGRFTSNSGAPGWFFALADKPTKAAITAMHEDPMHRWILQAMAGRRHAANHLRSEIQRNSWEIQRDGWRVAHGTPDALVDGGGRGGLANPSDPIFVIARSLGYCSESAFSTPSRGSWAVRHGNIAVAGSQLSFT